MVTALFTVCLVTVIRRFWNNLLRDEGYLTLTLPAPVWTLTASKAIAALCISLLSILVVILSIGIATMVSDSGRIVDFFELLSRALSDYGVGTIITGAVGMLIMYVQQLFLIYAVITAGRILSRFSGLASWIAYLAVMSLVHQPITQALSRAFERSADVRAILIFCLIEAALGAVFFCLTNLLLKRTVNLD
jgi:hypothetical protein